MSVQPDGGPTDVQTAVGNADEFLHQHDAFPETSLSRVIDRALILIGKAASWLWLAVVGVIIYAVIGRYAFEQGTITLEEMSWHIAGAAWLLGLSYTYAVDDHVRVDVIHERMSLRVRGWVELLGLVFLLMPFLVLATMEALPYAMASFQQGERSQAPAGLPNRWILKAILATSFMLLLVGAIARLSRVTALLFGFPKPLAPAGEAGQ